MCKPRHCNLTPVRKPEQARQELRIDRWKQIIAGQEYIQDKFRMARHEVHGDVGSDAECYEVGSSTSGFITDEEADRCSGCIE